MMYHGWYGGWGWGAWLAMAILMLVFWGIVAAAVVVFVRSLGRHREDHSPGASAREDQASRILDERFARGEIDAEEYRSRRDLLRS